jgi:ABC-2 type transport system permease protein
VKAAFPFLIQPTWRSALNRARRRERGDGIRASLFGTIGLAVALVIFGVVFWLVWRLLEYEELGEYLLRLGLSWLFLTLLSFLAFSALVTALSTFFLSEDLRLLLVAPVPPERLFYARYARTAALASWMVAVFVLPVLLGIGVARCAPLAYYAWAAATVVPFVLIPVSAGCLVTLLLVNVFPARRAREVLMLMGLLMSVGLVLLLRFIRPERLLDVASLPDIAGFFSTFQVPLGPLAPSFWAGETLFSALHGERDWLHLGSLWSTALASMVLARVAFGRWYFDGWSKAQEARKARFTRLRTLDRLAAWLPLPGPTRALLVKDVKVFMRDTTQWSQLLLLMALGLVYLYNFKALDLARIPWMGPLLKNLYAFLNLALAAFVLAAVAVRFVFPAVSAEGQAFWIVRSAPVSMRAFLWSKFWTGWLPLVTLTELLAITANRFLAVRPELQILSACAVVFMSLALVGLAAGLGAQYPRFSAENLTQVAGSYGGVVFMVLAVLYIVLTTALLAWPAATFMWHDYQHVPIPSGVAGWMVAALAAAVGLSLVTFWLPMRRGITALERLRG